MTHLGRKKEGGYCIRMEVKFIKNSSKFLTVLYILLILIKFTLKNKTKSYTLAVASNGRILAESFALITKL